MKYLLIIILVCSAQLSSAQEKLVPGKKAIEKKWIRNEQYRMGWYAIKDTSEIEIGAITTVVSKNKGRLTVITRVDKKQMQSPWVDSTIADLKNLAPVYHSSYNQQRDMVLHFGKIITGYYHDKIKNMVTQINDSTNESYFDSNIYPCLIRWLPLQEGFTQVIPIYDYSPSGKKGVVKVFVKAIKKGTYTSAVSGIHDVWIVTVADEIGGIENKTVYYFGIRDRKIWKQDIIIGDRKMMLRLMETI